MIPEISWAVGPSSRNHVQLSPWPPRAAPVKGRTIPTRPPKPTGDSWTGSWSVLAVLTKLSRTSRQLPMEIYFHISTKQLINLDCDDIFRALLVFFSFSSLHPDLDARPGCLSLLAGKEQPHCEETDKPEAGGGGRDAKGLGSNPPGCLKGLTDSASLPPARSPGEAGKLRLGTSLSLLTPGATPGEAGTAAMLRPPGSGSGAGVRARLRSPGCRMAARRGLPRRLPAGRGAHEGLRRRIPWPGFGAGLFPSNSRCPYCTPRSISLLTSRGTRSDAGRLSSVLIRTD